MKRYWPVLRHWSIISLFFLGFAFPVYADWNSFIINYNNYNLMNNLIIYVS